MQLDDSKMLDEIFDAEGKLYRHEDVLMYIQGLTMDEGFFKRVSRIKEPLLIDLHDIIISSNLTLRKLAANALVNLACNGEVANLICNLKHSGLPFEEDQFLQYSLKLTLKPASPLADIMSKLLTNLTVNTKIAERTSELIIKNVSRMYMMVDAITDQTYNSEGCNLDYIAQVMANLSQTYSFRRFLLTYEESFLHRILSVISNGKSEICKSGIIATIKNCCFCYEFHKELLGPTFNVLPSILYPLAGPEELDEEDTKKLPIDLQYLPPCKLREENQENRKNLLEALYQLCATRKSREFMREKNVYVILKAYYFWETNVSNFTLCEEIISLLIRNEEEIDCDNLHKCDIPSNIVSEFHKLKLENN